MTPLTIGMCLGLIMSVIIIYQQYWWIVHLDIKLTHEKNKNEGYQQMIEDIEQKQAEAMFAEREANPRPTPQREPTLMRDYTTLTMMEGDKVIAEIKPSKRYVRGWGQGIEQSDDGINWEPLPQKEPQTLPEREEEATRKATSIFDSDPHPDKPQYPG